MTQARILSSKMRRNKAAPAAAAAQQQVQQLAVKYGGNHLGLQAGSRSMVLRAPLKKSNSRKDGNEQPNEA